MPGLLHGRRSMQLRNQAPEGPLPLSLSEPKLMGEETHAPGELAVTREVPSFWSAPFR